MSSRGRVTITSVVVASNRETALLDQCLASLREQCHRVDARLIVARPADADPPLDALRKLYPQVQFVTAPRSDIPSLRGAGLAHATGEASAVTEDHCVAADDWLDELSGALAGSDVVGGGMGNAQHRAVDWGAYFAEYGFFGWTRPAAQPGAFPLVTGANVAYAESVRARVAAWAGQGHWEGVVHGRLHAEGRTIRFAPGAHILQNKQYRAWSFCEDRYQHGRDYARERLAEEGSARRWLRFLATPLLAGLLTVRAARASANLNRVAFLRALPWTLAFLTAWSIGEAVGYVQGPTPRHD